jgi:tRNA pseudouridine38-40 synthase
LTQKNYKFTLQFDGTDFLGWQVQAKGRTVQGDIEIALGKLFPGEDITLIGAGRTDSGVHALGMTANVKLLAKYDAEELRRAVNGNLEMDVRIDFVEEMPDEYHARFSAVAREYEYHFMKQYSPIRRKYAAHLSHNVDFSLLQKCAEQLKGEFDFTSFCKANAEVENKVCIIEFAEWKTMDNQLIFRIKANRFLHHMVRFLVGTMVEVARGRYTVNEFSALLFNTPAKAIVVRAPAHGLYLKKVYYKERL